MERLTPEIERDVDRLVTLLGQLLDEHTRLLATMGRKRELMRQSAHAGMTAVCRLESQCVRRITELERQRLEQVAALTGRLVPDAAEPMRLRDLAERLPEPARGRLLVARQQLVQRMEQVQQQTTVIRRAAESLVRHMTGLMQTIGSLSTGVSTYNRVGQRPEAAVTMRTVNLTA